jgi:DNA-binding transcriptional ArsR family regulator
METEIHQLARQQAELCSVLGNSRRVLILWYLAKREMCVGEIAKEIGTTLQNASQHLRLMKDKNVVKSRREGQTIYYRIADNEIMEKCSVLLNSPLNEAVQE